MGNRTNGGGDSVTAGALAARPLAEDDAVEQPAVGVGAGPVGGTLGDEPGLLGAVALGQPHVAGVDGCTDDVGDRPVAASMPHREVGAVLDHRIPVRDHLGFVAQVRGQEVVVHRRTVDAEHHVAGIDHPHGDVGLVEVVLVGLVEQPDRGERLTPERRVGAHQAGVQPTARHAHGGVGRRIEERSHRGDR